MSTAIFWALVAGVLALRLTPLWGILMGIVAAVLGVAVNVSMVAASGSVLVSSLGGPGQGSGVPRLVETLCIAIFAACGLMIIALVYLLNGGRVGFSRG